MWADITTSNFREAGVIFYCSKTSSQVFEKNILFGISPSFENFSNTQSETKF